MYKRQIWLYQRLIEQNKIKKIRTFLEEKGEAFFNNIIVALPDTVAFKDEMCIRDSCKALSYT